MTLKVGLYGVTCCMARVMMTRVMEQITNNHVLHETKLECEHLASTRCLKRRGVFFKLPYLLCFSNFSMVVAI